MSRSRFLPHPAWAALLCMLASPVPAEGMKAAEKRCEALGGSLDGGMIETGAGYGSFDAAASLRKGRSEEFRRRVASNDAHSHLLTSAH